MFEKALSGDKKYWTWIFFLMAIMGVGFLCWLYQFKNGLSVTGLSRDVSWGFYIAQFTFLVGVAASAVMVVLPYYLHNYKAFGKITILGEFLAIGSVLMCMTFIFVDMGQPFRSLNVILHPTLNSPMFWDFISLGGYLGLNILIGLIALESERKSEAPPKWIKPFIYLSIPWAVSIHTVTAFLYQGLGARHFWMTAIMAPRFLASAFSAGPALLILLCFVLRKVSKFDAGREAIQKLAEIVTYAMAVNVFFVCMEFFTALYSDLPAAVVHFKYLFIGLEGASLAPWMWISSILAIVSLILLINPRTRRNEKTLIVACITTYTSLWIDKGLGLVVAGFIPNPLGKVQAYIPTAIELMISLSIYAMGAFIVTILYKITLSVREELAA
ncbi:sulfate reduction electron transfer complex DsrMKJOP subunit DsrP [candidate division CSSED10-310 bacterium]|uniref:Sulfate reduction electron transfer complex DsrMKJOP subunit DsrP n=1 Tax=candidate division CSSED10-310 bacterium TaxID=2855610 RepID=A0ABV6YRU4_UNCC1